MQTKIAANETWPVKTDNGTIKEKNSDIECKQSINTSLCFIEKF